MRVNLDKTKMMVSGLEENVTASKIDPCRVCGRRVKINVDLAWPRTLLAQHVYTTLHQDSKEPNENLCDGEETANEFCYLGDKLKTRGGYEAAVTAKMRIGWIKFRECSELLLGKRFSVKIKAKGFQSSVRCAML